MENLNIRNQLKQNDIKFWQLADALHVSEATITRMFRHPLTAEQQQAVMNIIEKRSVKHAGKL